LVWKRPKATVPGHGGLPRMAALVRMGLGLAARSGASAAWQARLHIACTRRNHNVVTTHRPCMVERLSVAHHCLPHGAVLPRRMRRVPGARRRRVELTEVSNAGGVLCEI
jgi:hypothetical protein